MKRVAAIPEVPTVCEGGDWRGRRRHLGRPLRPGQDLSARCQALTLKWDPPESKPLNSSARQRAKMSSQMPYRLPAGTASKHLAQGLVINVNAYGTAIDHVRCFADLFPCSDRAFPCFLEQGKHGASGGVLLRNSPRARPVYTQFRGFSLFFRRKTGKIRGETGSHGLASPPRTRRRSEISWLATNCAELARSSGPTGPPETAHLRLGGHFRRFVSGHKIPFPGNGDRRGQRLGSNAALTAKEGRASGAGETIQPADRRGEQLPFHEGAGLR